MSALAAFAAHCRVMAGAEHKPTCSGAATDRWGWTRRVRPNPHCPGCVTAADRALWTRLADEVEAYIDPHPTLWGDEDDAGMAQNGPETARGRDGGASCVSPDPADDDSAREGTL